MIDIPVKADEFTSSKAAVTAYRENLNMVLNPIRWVKIREVEKMQSDVTIPSTLLMSSQKLKDF